MPTSIPRGLLNATTTRTPTVYASWSTTQPWPAAVSISSISRDAGSPATVSVTTASAHGLSNNSDVHITGVAAGLIKADVTASGGTRTGTDCVATTNATHVIRNGEAGQATRVQVRAGATQGTEPLLEFRNNANSSTIASIGASGQILFGSLALAGLGTPANGTQVYCTDCLKGSDPCTGSSTGAMAMRVNGAWQCM